MSPIVAKMTIDSNTRRVSYDTNLVTTKEILATITITATATIHVPTVTASDYSIDVTFVPRECKTFTFNLPTLTAMAVEDYKDFKQEFDDLGDEVATAGKCGTRSYKLVDSSGVDNALSWITL